jgi:hypothetical protein
MPKNTKKRGRLCYFFLRNCVRVKEIRVKIALNHFQIIFLRSKTSLTCFSLVEGGLGKSEIRVK